jgi:hypothetical protein
MSIASKLERLLAVHMDAALSDDVLISDTDDDLNWHAFLGHHDFWRFRGDLFFLHGRGSFVPLRRRSRPLGIDFLATAWHQLERVNPENRSGKNLLHRYRWSKANAAHKLNLQSDLSAGGAESQEYLTCWREFGGGVPHWYAYILFDAAVLADRFSSSFRTYLERTCSGIASGHADLGSFPKMNWRAPVHYDRGEAVSFEEALAKQITADFAVGDEVARYLFCDWLLALWQDDHTALFDTFKHDENAVNFGKAHSWYGDRSEFLGLCHQLRPDLPPRVINECIWLHQNQGCRCLGEVPATTAMIPPPQAQVTPTVVQLEDVSVEIFQDDDDGYRRWLTAHPHGFVLNCERAPRADYLKLHRARCRWTRPAGMLTGAYIKICSDDTSRIAGWARARTGGTPQPCGHCHP